jgi:hypothetical protein
MKVAEDCREHGQDATKVKFLVFESMAESRVELRATLVSLITHFGEAIRPGIVVVVSKYDTRSGAAAELRLAKILEMMRELGLSKLVPWQSVGLDPEGQQEQLAALKTKLDDASPVSTTDLQFFWQRQQERQQQLCDGQPTRIKKVEVEETYSQPYKATEKYTDVESYTEPESRTVPVQKSRQVKGDPKGPFVKNIRFLPEWGDCWLVSARERDLGGKGGFWKYDIDYTDKPQEAIRSISLVKCSDCWPSLPAGSELISLNMEKHPPGYESHPKKFLSITRNGDAPPVTEVIVLQIDCHSERGDPDFWHSPPVGEWTMVPQNVMCTRISRVCRYLGYKVAPKVPDKTVTETVYETQTIHVTKQRSVTKSKEVTRYRDATRKVTKDVEYRLAFEDFYHQAYDEVLREIRRDFVANS